MLRWRLAALLGVVVCSALAWKLFLPDAGSGRNDFLALYAGGTLAGTSEIYNPQSVRDVQLHAIGEWGDSLQFSRLPYYALVLKPLTLLPYRWAYLIWEILSVAALAGFVALWPSTNERYKWVACCWSLPAFVALFDGQDVSFLLLWIALAVCAHRNGRPVLSGALLALCAAKYHLVVLVPLVIIAQRRWRMAAGAAAAGSVLLAISFAVAGPAWPWRYYAVITDARIHVGVRSMPNFHAMLAGLPFSTILEILASGAVAALVFVAARRQPLFEWSMALALVAGILVSFHSYVMDCALLLPPILLVLDSVMAAPLRIAALVLATPIPWFFLNLPAPLPTATRLLLVFLVLRMAWPAARGAAHASAATSEIGSLARTAPASSTRA